jgi:hypothetical protein
MIAVDVVMIAVDVSEESEAPNQKERGSFVEPDNAEHPSVPDIPKHPFVLETEVMVMIAVDVSEES